MPVVIKQDECEGCGTCMTVCSRSAISIEESVGKMVAKIDPEECEECGECIAFCMRGAIKQERS